MPLSKREAREIVDYVAQEIMKRRFPYVTDNKLDFSKTSVGAISGTQVYGGQIADGAIYDRQVHPNANIQGTKVRIATELARGVVTLGTGGQALVPTMSGLLSTTLGLGASLIGICDDEEELVSTNVEAALHELKGITSVLAFLDLIDVPNTYMGNALNVATVTPSENGLEFRPVDYIFGGLFTDTFAGALILSRAEVDAGTFTNNAILDGGSL